MARLLWEKVKPVQIAQNYNDGVILFYTKEQATDEYNTAIRGEFETTEVYKDWFRRLGVTAQDVYYSNADDSKVTEKVAIRGNVKVDSKWFARIENEEYEIYRVYYNGANSETEISLAEVYDNEK